MNSHSPLDEVVKYVIEFVYREFKKEFSDDQNSKNLIQRYKTTLLASTETLIKRVEELFSKKFVNPVSSTEPPNKNFATASKVSHNNHGLISNRLFYIVQSHDCTEKWPGRVKLIDGEFNTKYQLEIKSFTTTPPNEEGLRCESSVTFERSFSEIKKLQLVLEKHFPSFILPSVTISQSNGIEKGVVSRQRHLKLWMEYVLNIPEMRSFTPFFEPSSDDNRNYKQQSGLNISTSNSSNKSREISDDEQLIAKIFNNVFRSESNSRRSNLKYENAVVFKKRCFDVISSQVRILLPIGSDAIQKGSAVYASLNECNGCINTTGIAHVQRDDDGSIISLLDTFKESMDTTSAHYAKYEIAFSECMLEPLSFYYGCGLRKAKDILSKYSAGTGDTSNEIKSSKSSLRSWSVFRQIKGCTLLSKMILLVQKTIDTHRETIGQLKKLSEKIHTASDTSHQEENNPQQLTTVNTSGSGWRYMANILGRVTIPLGSRRKPAHLPAVVANSKNEKVHLSCEEDPIPPRVSDNKLSDRYSDLNSKRKYQVTTITTSNPEKVDISHEEDQVPQVSDNRHSDVHVKRKHHIPRGKKTILKTSALPKSFYDVSTAIPTRNEDGTNGNGFLQQDVEDVPSAPPVDDVHDADDAIVDNDTVTHDNHEADVYILPAGWDVAFTAEGKPYFFHQVAKLSRWSPPTEEVALLIDQRLAKLNDEVQVNAKKRMMTIEQQQSKVSSKELVVDKLRNEIRSALYKWKNPPSLPRPRDFGEMLSTLHTIIPTIAENEIVGEESLTSHSSPNLIKKAYLRAIRMLHPDKFDASMTEEEKILAEEVFISINEEYNVYKAKMSR